jgi:molecular chaperone DnaJ
MKDYYKILEIEENASQEDIKKSYRSLSKKYHPDVNPDGAEKFKEIAEAYSILGDPDKRQKYHQSKSNPFSGTEFENFFSNMFVNANNGRRRKNAPDKVIKLKITPIDSYRGSEKNIEYVQNVHCKTCTGTGGEQQICRECGGNGFVINTFGTGYFVQQMRSQCNSCGGNGFTLLNKCGDCSGSGTKAEKKSFSIKIPIGVDNGQFFRMESNGDFNRGDYGDLIIQLEMVNEDGFEKMNNNLVYNLYLNLDELLQEKFTIPHPDGELKITPPKLFDTSKPLRVKGKGYSGGDMYVNLEVRFERN